MLRMPLVLTLLLPACVNIPVGAQGPGGAPAMATTPGPTAAGLNSAEGITAQNCAAYRQTATKAMMMTPQLDAQLKAQGC